MGNTLYVILLHYVCSTEEISLRFRISRKNKEIVPSVLHAKQSFKNAILFKHTLAFIQPRKG